MSELKTLTQAVLDFRDARAWRQFHSLRHLMVSLTLEAGELLELTQWKPDEEIEAIPHDPVALEALQDECADILLYLLLIAEKTGTDLAEAAWRKMAKNAQKYPVEQCYGSSAKYNKRMAHLSDAIPASPHADAP